MKKLTGVAVIIACLSITYYFAIFLPSTSKTTNRASGVSSKEDLQLQEKCSKLAKEYFENQAIDVSKGYASYTCHYNKKLNKYLIHIKYVIFDKDLNGKSFSVNSEWIADILANKEIVSIMSGSSNKPILYMDGGAREPQFGEWEKIVKENMED